MASVKSDIYIAFPVVGVSFSLIIIASNAQYIQILPILVLLLTAPIFALGDKLENPAIIQYIILQLFKSPIANCQSSLLDTY
jgi:hypothetical protein